MTDERRDRPSRPCRPGAALMSASPPSTRTYFPSACSIARLERSVSTGSPAASAALRLPCPPSAGVRFSRRACKPDGRQLAVHCSDWRHSGTRIVSGLESRCLLAGRCAGRDTSWNQALALSFAGAFWLCTRLAFAELPRLVRSTDSDSRNQCPDVQARPAGLLGRRRLGVPVGWKVDADAVTV